MPTIELPELYPKQYRAIYSPARYSWIEASTKAGKTFGCLIWQLQQVAEDTHEREHWWVAPVYQQAQIAFRRAKSMLHRAGARELFSSTKQPPVIELNNGARWGFKSAENPDNLYGEDVSDAILDEASRMREESWHAIRSTLTATRGDIRGIGNVTGRKNWFYRMCRLAEQGRDDHDYHKLTAWDAVDGGVLDAGEIEDAKETLPDHVYRQLYLAEPADDGGNPFGQDAIDERVSPKSESQSVCWGWDLAKSQDWTVGIGLDANGAVCEFHRFQRPWKHTIQTIERVTDAPALVDSTGVGDPVVEQLDGTKFEGFKFTRSSKQQLMERLSVAIQSGDISYPDGPIVDELRTFEYSPYRGGVRYEAPSGLHDDCVCALALAVKMYRRASKKREPINVNRSKISPDLTSSIDLGY